MAKRWTFTGSGRDDDFDGTDGRDLARGRGGDDRLEGDDGDDLLVGGRGRDRLEGDDGDDVLRGGAGDDRLEGGDGFDRLFGGKGRDRFEVDHDDDARTVIMDFQLGKDVIVFDEDDDDGFSDFEDMLASARQRRDDVVIRTEDGAKVVIKDVDLDALDAGDFLFG
ncbi:calcium-binding protein [uncultured Albimonas sp.]|uniref:calcium-binding protein n=1 Tax=uncultured Albimonas sp. TaxID=1331701 RepID=UPI0030EBBCAD|tara:strand:- start:2575 stop:3072 length:498 start_codon:yes stop_codon:yes gene_type:complete